MRKYCKILLINFFIILFAVFAFGCWDSRDINEKTIATTTAFDYKDGEIVAYIETANIEATQSGGGGATVGKKFNVLTVHGKDLTEMRYNLETALNKPLFLSGVSTLIFTENFANKYLIEYMYRFRADESYRKKGYTVFTKLDPEELFKVAQEKNESLGITIDDLSKTLVSKGETFSRTTERVVENLSSSYSGILISNIGIVDNKISLIGYSSLQADKITGFIPTEEAKGLIFLKADNPELSYIVTYKDLKLTIEVTAKKPKIKPSYKDGKISFDLKLNFDAKLLYGDKKTPYDLTKEDMKEIGDNLNEMLKKELEKTVYDAQNKYKCDYLQFDDIFRIKYPEEFEKMDWKNEFEKISVTINTEVNLTYAYMMDYNTGKPK